MTEQTWRDYDTHLMQKGPTANGTFHAVKNCPRIDTPEKTIKRNETYVSYHEPDPCPICHPEVPAGNGADELVIVTAGEAHRYHRSEGCYYAAQMDSTERIRISTADDDGLEPCNWCAAEEREDAEPIEVCPDCDRAQFEAVIGSVHSPGVSEHEYRCNECGARFDKPAVRARKKSQNSNHGGLAGKLMQADPDDVSAENAGEPMTDGGEDVVYYASGMYDVYHERRDCRYLKLADGIHEMAVSTLNGTRDPCGVCAEADSSETEKLVTDGGRPGGHSECPQGCRSPVAGRETMEYREETVPVEPPNVFEIYGETVVQTERIEQYAECIVCGWGYSL